MEALISYINSKVALPEPQLREILSAFARKAYKKDEAIIRAGQYVSRYYFIAQGGIRIVIDTPGREVTAWMLFEHNFFSDLQALRTGQAAKAKAVAIGDTEVYSIDAQKMFAFFGRFPQWQAFGRIMMEDAFLNVVESLISFQTMDAETRYLHLLQKSEAIHRVPLKQLASYLGITPNSLSRIRKNIT